MPESDKKNCVQELLPLFPSKSSCKKGSKESSEARDNELITSAAKINAVIMLMSIRGSNLCNHKVTARSPHSLKRRVKTLVDVDVP